MSITGSVISGSTGGRFNPGILLTTALADVNLWTLVFYTFPLTAVVVVAGYWPIRKVAFSRVPNGPDGEPFSRAIRPFLRELAPIAWVIAGGLGLGLAASGRMPSPLNQVEKELGLIVALLAAIVWVWRAKRYGLAPALGPCGPAGPC